MTVRMIKPITLILRLLQLSMAAYIASVISYHTWEFATNRLSLTDASSGQLPKALYAILVISCVAVLYTFLSLFIGCFGHKKIFLVTLVMDFLLLGGFIAVSILMRGSADMSCGGAEYSNRITFSSNNFPSNIYGSGGRKGNHPEILCRLDKAVFALAVALSVLFLLTLFLSYLGLKNHRENRAFGPGPANGYSLRNNPAPRSWKHNPFSRSSEEPGSRVSADDGRIAPHHMF